MQRIGHTSPHYGTVRDQQTISVHIEIKVDPDFLESIRTHQDQRCQIGVDANITNFL
jgi:hypothetical protein